MFANEKDSVRDLLCHVRLVEILSARIVNHGLPGSDLQDMALAIHGVTQRLLKAVEGMDALIHSIGYCKEISHDD